MYVFSISTAVLHASARPSDLQVSHSHVDVDWYNQCRYLAKLVNILKVPVVTVCI